MGSIVAHTGTRWQGGCPPSRGHAIWPYRAITIPAPSRREPAKKSSVRPPPLADTPSNPQVPVPLDFRNRSILWDAICSARVRDPSRWVAGSRTRLEHGASDLRLASASRAPTSRALICHQKAGIVGASKPAHGAHVPSLGRRLSDLPAPAHPHGPGHPLGEPERPGACGRAGRLARGRHRDERLAGRR